ncbi:MAG: Ig-like domain-containing protein [Gemmatimonadaceae bacterium]
MRRLTSLPAAAALLAVGACASPGVPPGAPPDELAPRLLKVSPESGTVAARLREMQFLFSEVVSERPQGAADLHSLFLLSPYDGEPRISWKRTRIEVAPRDGWRANTTYVVRLLPGISDLRGNADSVGRTIVFSTGGSLAAGKVRGIVFDWIAQRSAPRAFVSAIALPVVGRDSVRYVTVADSLGSFLLGALPPGRYFLRALIDENRNRAVDPREGFDTATVLVQDSLSREMLALPRDTIGPGITTVNRVDSLMLRVAFDRGLDSLQTLTPDHFSLKDRDSVAQRIAAIVPAREFERARADSARRQAVQDSLRRAAAQDSARRADSARAGAAVRPLGRRPQPPARPPAADTGRRPAPPPKPSVLPPATEVILRLARPLRAAAEYRLGANDIRSFLGWRRSSERVFQTPRVAPPDTARRDTTRRDTTQRRPAAPGSGR